MPFLYITDPEKLAMLTAVVDDICREAGIEPASDEYQEAAYMVMRFYWAGYRTTRQWAGSATADRRCLLKLAFANIDRDGRGLSAWQKTIVGPPAMSSMGI